MINITLNLIIILKFLNPKYSAWDNYCCKAEIASKKKKKKIYTIQLYSVQLFNQLFTRILKI